MNLRENKVEVETTLYSYNGKAYFERELTKICLGEFNDQNLRDKVIDFIEEHCIFDYKILCSENNNSPLDIDQHKLNVEVAIEFKGV